MAARHGASRQVEPPIWVLHRRTWRRATRSGIRFRFYLLQARPGPKVSNRALRVDPKPIDFALHAYDSRRDEPLRSGGARKLADFDLERRLKGPAGKSESEI